MDKSKFNIFIGYDSREDIAYQVCKQSILDKCKHPNDLEIIPLKLDELREQGMYWREEDKLGSTEFTFSRFLVPQLMDFDGWALFIDCDFLFLDDIKKIWQYKNENNALLCVKHDYTPTAEIKMDGKAQTVYPRKNWSSCVLWNCGHPTNKKITKELVSDPTVPGQYLHRFTWVPDKEIGELPKEWNWLIGWYKEPNDGQPKALHYTEGGPWFKDYETCEYAANWLLVEKNYQKQVKKNKIKKSGPFDDIPEDKKEVFKSILNYWIDPECNYFEDTFDGIIEKIRSVMGNKVIAIDSEGGINYSNAGHNFDPILRSFAIGAQGVISNWDKEKDNLDPNATPLAIRGLGGGSRKAIQQCMKTGRTFYTVDTGYFGNTKTKYIHRVTKNAMQYTKGIIDRDIERARSFGYRFKKFTKGTKILICPPSMKVMELFGQPNPEDWVKDIRMQLKKLTDRPIEIRLKPNRTERVTTKTIQAALQDDVHCLVTYNSIAAIEALMEGKPAMVLGPNAAQRVAETNLKNIENPKYPNKDEMDAFMAHLAYCQFTVPEMESGYAWNTVNESN